MILEKNLGGEKLNNIPRLKVFDEIIKEREAKLKKLEDSKKMLEVEIDFERDAVRYFKSELERIKSGTT